MTEIELLDREPSNSMEPTGHSTHRTAKIINDFENPDIPDIKKGREYSKEEWELGVDSV